MNQNKIITLMFAAILFYGCSNSDEVKKKPPIRVNTEVVSESNVGSGKTFVGIIEECSATAVSFTGMGVLRRVLVNEGQTIAEGQLIAEMDDTQARNMLAAAEAQMEQANDALERYTVLHDAGSLPEVSWVEIQSKVAQAKSQLEVARKNLKNCQLTAPTSGIVGKKLLGAGETALPSQAVITILDINNVKVKVSVPEAEINSIGTHSATSISVVAAGKELRGGQIEKGIQADALTHTYDVRINVANADHKLLPGMVASVLFVGATDGTQAELLLPITCVQQRSRGELFIWTIDNDNKAHRTNVNTAQTVGNKIVIKNGISQGQRVVTEGYQKLSEGTIVVY